MWKKKISAEVKKLIKTTRNKRSGGSILQIFKTCTFKTWNTIQKGACIFLLILVDTLILSVKNRGHGGVGGGALLKRQNFLSMMKVIVNSLLSFLSLIFSISHFFSHFLTFLLFFLLFHIHWINCHNFTFWRPHFTHLSSLVIQTR